MVPAPSLCPAEKFGAVLGGMWVRAVHAVGVSSSATRGHPEGPRTEKESLGFLNTFIVGHSVS